MEKGNRVQEIKKRFEGLNSQNSDSLVNPKRLISGDHQVVFPRSAKKICESDQYNIKGVIKRSHAFRSDKSKIKPISNSSTSSDSQCLTVNKVSRSELSSGRPSQGNIKLINHNILNSVNPPVVYTVPLKSANSSNKADKLTDTLKKALKNPLPPGPAPQKPPRTFAHAGRSLDLEESLQERKCALKNQLSDSLLLKNNGSTSLSNHFIALSSRSKTEPHIMLKKLESALLSNQLKTLNSCKISSKPSLSAVKSNTNSDDNTPNNDLPSKTRNLCLNGLTSCINHNIYDKPFEPKSTFFIGSPKQKRIIKLPPKNTTYGRIHKDTESPHIYEEPYSPRNERKFETSNKNELSLKTPSPKPSVHYMSSPIREAKKLIPKQEQEEIINVSPVSAKEEKIKMITDAFNDNARSDSDADSIQDEKNGNLEEVTAVRKVYAKRVSSMRQQTPRFTQGQNLFEALLLIGIDQDPKIGQVPYIKSKFPERASIPESLPELVFPDAGDWPPVPQSLSRHHNNYKLVLTSGDGSRKYAYCRRLQPEGAPFCLPLAYVLISVYSDNIFYYSILAELETRHGFPEADYIQFIQNLYKFKLPKPGFNIKIGETVFRRAADPRQESYDISRILSSVTVPSFIKILSTLLIERKVIIIGSNISLVSDCIEGLLKALFPFGWEHTLVGAVPSRMLELCMAPTPFLMGVIRPKQSPQFANFLPLTSIDNCLVADIDSGEILMSCGDENSLLPSRLISCLRSALYLCPVHGNDVGPSEAMIRLFVELVGHYNNHVITDVHSNNRTFQKEAFIKAAKSRSVQLFLDWFTDTAMFHSFIQRRLDRSFEPGLFEQRCAEYIEENVKNHNITKKDKSLNKTVKIIGDRFKDWTSSS